MSFYRNKWFWAIAIILLLSSSLFLYLKVFNAPSVKVLKAVRQRLIITVTATSTGTIKSDHDAKITARRTGRITSLMIEEGDIVKNGSVVAELDRAEALHNLSMAEATFQKSEHILNQIKASFDFFKVDIEKNIDKARATLSETESRLKRFTGLKEMEFISDMDLDSVQKEYAVAKANLASAIASREQVKAKASEIKAQEAAVIEAKDNRAISRLAYEYSFVTSPLSGVITSRPVKLGEGTAASTLIATVVSFDSLYIEAFIDEADVAKISRGQLVNIAMDAYPGMVYAGEVYRISPVVLGGKQETRTFEARVRFKNTPPVIKPGMSADIEIQVDSIDNALVIPSQAITEKEGKKFVYIVKDSRLKLVTINPGKFNWNLTEVKSGISEGDDVVINTETQKLKEGMRAKIK